MRAFEGLGVAPGIAIGPIYPYSRTTHDVEHREISQTDVEDEIDRFKWALSKSERDLKKISAVTREKLGEDSASIFDAQIMMLHDEALREAVLRRIQEKRCNADYAVKQVMTEHRRRVQSSDSEYLRERSNDLLDVQERIITHLRRGKLLSKVDTESVIVAENLTAADIVLFSRRDILGVALDFGGATSHVSIMARALGVPAVTSLHGLADEVRHGDTIILDGIEGRVILNPDADTLDRYRTRRERYRRVVQEHKQLVPLAAETIDHHEVSLRGNLEFVEELPLLEEYGADGIGLFRTEMLFLMRGRFNYSEDDQYEVYRQIVESVRPATTTFRLLDLGGDKMLPVAHREHNPFLGWRGIRILLDREEVLLPQLRALLRAGVHGPTRILIPMITQLDELHRFREYLERAKRELTEEDIPFADDVPVGIMVEVPAVALMADRFAAEADFFSIGSNDLTQYTVATDRGNDLVSDRYEELNPGVLSLIQRTVEAGHAAGISVGVCGEMGGKPRNTPILVGLGVDEISASPTYLPEVKRVIRALQFSEAQALAEEALNSSSEASIKAMLDTWLDEHGCGLLHMISSEASDEAAASPDVDASTVDVQQR
ncbi:MAG: phosphoenolpyruvate--protein phosphotransferase [Bacteroidetes bacterium]|jgi:phosphotransferase system enzyme I (PtsI)|nr:phosphoenolpyruvate--protein phosphotransferase [Bacteroidota bacterium]